MRFFRSKEDSLKFWLSFFYIMGSIGGSVFCNCMSPEGKAEFLQVEQQAILSASLGSVDFRRLFMKILWKRAGELSVLLLMVSTPMAEKLRLAAVMYLGISGALMVCSLTMGAGVWGMWNYLCLSIPQGLFYLLIGYLLFWWMPSAGKRLTVGAVCALMAILCLGVAAETYINPHFWTFLFKN